MVSYLYSMAEKIRLVNTANRINPLVVFGERFEHSSLPRFYIG